MRIALYGGSFDPIHQGHIEPVLEARAALNLERVFYLPTARPPHKSRQMAPAMARFAMVEMALLDYPQLRVSDFEMRSETHNSEPTFTIDSVEHFRRLYPESSLHLIVGADSFLALDTWKRYEDLLRLSRLLVLVRPGSEPSQDASLPKVLRQAVDGGRVQFIENSPLAVSSTELRRQLASGIRPQNLPDRVLNYIRKYGLYRS